MVRRLLICFAVLASGCTTAPQADVMDFVFRSRNACAQPQPVMPVTNAMVLQQGPVVPAQPPVKEGCCAQCGGKKKDCALCRPFQIFRRNRNPQ